MEPILEERDVLKEALLNFVSCANVQQRARNVGLEIEERPGWRCRFDDP